MAAEDVPDGTFFTACHDGELKRSLWLKVNGALTLISGAMGVLVPERSCLGLSFSNYQPVDVEITYTPCK